jgi:hypothetical protein
MRENLFIEKLYHLSIWNRSQVATLVQVTDFSSRHEGIVGISTPFSKTGDIYEIPYPRVALRGETSNI